MQDGNQEDPIRLAGERYSWLQDGVPSIPDFSLSQDATCITDLISWSNAHPVQGGEAEKHQVPAEDEKEHAEKVADEDLRHESKHEVEAAKKNQAIDFTDISNELLLPCNNSLFFLIEPFIGKRVL